MPAQRAVRLTESTVAGLPRPAIQQWHVLTSALLAADAASLALAFGLAYVIRFRTGIPLLETPPHSAEFYSSLVRMAVPVWLVLFALFGLYDRRNLFEGLQEYTRLANACTVGMMAIIVMTFLDVSVSISRGWVLLVWVLSMLSTGTARLATRRVLNHVRSRGYLTVSTAIVGTGGEGRALAEQFLADPGSGMRIVGFVDGSAPSGTKVVGDLDVLGGLRQLERLVNHGTVKQVVVAMSDLSREDLLDLYRTLGHNEKVEIRLSSGLFELLTTGVTVQETSCVPLMTPQRVRITGVNAALKTILDYVLALLALALLAPAMLLIAVAIKLDSTGPVIHRRRVLGRSGKPFDAFKFRTMVVNADEVLASDPSLREAFDRGYKLKSDPRVTAVGSLLRRTSLDELPQLANVLRGEMSLVGPRMIAPEESARYGKWQLNLLTVKPGITGPWQVNGRGDVSYEERVRLNMHYIRNYSIWLDFEILLKTVPAVLQRKGAY